MTDYAMVVETATKDHDLDVLDAALKVRLGAANVVRRRDLLSFVEWVALQNSSDHVFIGSHAEKAAVYLPLSAKAGIEDLGWELIARADASATNQVRLDLDLLQSKLRLLPGLGNPLTVDLCGCNVGQNVELLKQLKRLFMQTNHKLRAPKHWHMVERLTGAGGGNGGVLEYMACELAVSSPKAMKTPKDRFELIARAVWQFTGQIIEPTLRQWFVRRGKTTLDKLDLHLKFAGGVSALPRDILVFRLELKEYVEHVRASKPDEEPWTDVLLKEALLRKPSFAPTAHNYNIPRDQYGCATIDEFQKLWSWDLKKNKRIATGTRYEYWIKVPCGALGPGNQITIAEYNYYRPSGQHDRSLVETDNRFFAEV